MFWNLEVNSNPKNKLDELEKLKLKAQKVLEQQNKIVASIWDINYQLASIKFNKNEGINDERNKLEKEKEKLEALLKKNFSSEKINILYNKIANMEQELDSNFNRDEPYFIYTQKSSA